MVKRKINAIHILYTFIDLVMTFSIVFFAFAIYFFRGYQFSATDYITMFSYCGANALITVFVFFILKIYRIVTTHFSLYDAFKIAVTTFLIQSVGLVALLLLRYFGFFTPNIFAWGLSTLSLIFVCTGLRLSARAFHAFLRIRHKYATIRTIIIGAGAAGKIAFDEAIHNVNNNHKIVTFVDDDPSKIGGYFASTPVVGPINDIKIFIDKYNIEEVIIAIPSLPASRLHEIVLMLQPLNIRINCMPLLNEMNGPNDVRMTRIDIDALLDRKVIELDNSRVYDLLSGKTILVTGAGGSIGSELCRQIFLAHPKEIILFDIYENSTYIIEQELIWKMRKENINDVKLTTLIGSTYNLDRIEQVVRDYKPDYIYHAAAYKHVPLMETSPMEAIRTNIIGTYNVASVAAKYHVKGMLLVSTDKAVRPTNVMGASKRFAEMIIQYFSEHTKTTKFCAVRFGNVLGSNGSVVPLFAEQIKHGGPLTVTDKAIIRYFMTIPEAVGLILHCSMLAKSGELFILDMGTPVSIVNLAERMIRQAGFIPYKDIDIVFTGLRPGEKLYEELLVDLSHQDKTENGRIFIEHNEMAINVPEEIINITKAFSLDNNTEIKELLASIIKSYKITENKK